MKVKEPKEPAEFIDCADCNEDVPVYAARRCDVCGEVVCRWCDRKAQESGVCKRCARDMRKGA